MTREYKIKLDLDLEVYEFFLARSEANGTSLDYEINTVLKDYILLLLESKRK